MKILGRAQPYLLGVPTTMPRGAEPALSGARVGGDYCVEGECWSAGTGSRGDDEHLVCPQVQFCQPIRGELQLGSQGRISASADRGT